MFLLRVLASRHLFLLSSGFYVLPLILRSMGSLCVGFLIRPRCWLFTHCGCISLTILSVPSPCLCGHGLTSPVNVFVLFFVVAFHSHIQFTPCIIPSLCLCQQLIRLALQVEALK